MFAAGDWRSRNLHGKADPEIDALQVWLIHHLVPLHCPETSLKKLGKPEHQKQSHRQSRQRTPWSKMWYHCSDTRAPIWLWCQNHR